MLRRIVSDCIAVRNKQGPIGADAALIMLVVLNATGSFWH